MKKQLVYIGFIALCLAACRQSVSQKGEASVDAAELYKDSVFLEIKGDNLDALFFEGRVDPRIYYPAVLRIQRFTTVEGDTLRINLNSGAEVKISENIFDYYRSGIVQQNRHLQTDDRYEIRADTINGGYCIAPKDWEEGYGGLKSLP